MKKAMIFAATLVVALYFSFSLPAMAQRGRGAGNSGGNGPMMGAPGGMGSQGGSMHGMGQGNRPETAGPKMDHPQKGPEGRMGGDQKKTQTQETQQAGKKLTVADQLTRNEQLTTKLQGILPEGTNVQDAAVGFKNLGQFVAAAHVSHNLDIPFADLKTKMTGDGGMNLGDAIHELKPDVDETAEAKKAQEQAEKDLKESKANKEPVS
ncbi:MAG: hypothetical protein HY313_11450 [Acidobacteria bacterium]|nr:hypothetical protein [Acidobacteriota bacterium]